MASRSTAAGESRLYAILGALNANYEPWRDRLNESTMSDRKSTALGDTGDRLANLIRGRLMMLLRGMQVRRARKARETLEPGLHYAPTD